MGNVILQERSHFFSFLTAGVRTLVGTPLFGPHVLPTNPSGLVSFASWWAASELQGFNPTSQGAPWGLGSITWATARWIIGEERRVISLERWKYCFLAIPFLRWKFTLWMHIYKYLNFIIQLSWYRKHKQFFFNYSYIIFFSFIYISNLRKRNLISKNKKEEK